MSPRRAIVAALFVAVFGWLALRPQDVSSPDTPPGTVIRREFLAMGTQVSVTLATDTHTSAQANAAMDDVEHWLLAFGHDWAAWGDGTLATLNNALSRGEPVTIPPPMQPLFRRAWQFHEASGGLFEPRIGALVRLWGFDDIARLRQQPPAQADIDAALAALHAAPPYNNDAGYGPARDVAWDFGAIAKGYAVDAALAHLRDAGFTDAIVDAGGNLAVRGHRHDRPWRIAIRHPRADDKGADQSRFLATLDAGDEAVNTHGDYERYFEFGNRRYCHILDPSTGTSADGFESVTVVDPDSTRADAGGAALFVAGPARWRALATKLGLEQVLVVDTQGHVMTTAPLARRLHFESGVEAQVVP